LLDDRLKDCHQGWRKREQNPEPNGSREGAINIVLTG
jgi:hypothetical protein